MKKPQTFPAFTRALQVVRSARGHVEGFVAGTPLHATRELTGREKEADQRTFEAALDRCEREVKAELEQAYRAWRAQQRG